MAVKPSDRKRNELKKLQTRLGKPKSKTADNDEVLADLIRNMHAQKALAEWQEVLRHEQEVLVTQLRNSNQVSQPLPTESRQVTEWTEASD